jgi:predicted nucleic acid-binding protein
LIDTSIWIEVFRDKSKTKAAKLKAIIADRRYYLPIFFNITQSGGFDWV